MEEYVLYFLVIPKTKGFKIGITSKDRMFKRFAEIEKAFGPINKSKSIFYKSISLKDIKNTEKAMHIIFWKSKLDLKTKGSGYTEFIRRKEIDNAKKFLLDIKHVNGIKGPFTLIEKKHPYVSIIIKSILLLGFIYILLEAKQIHSIVLSFL